MIQRIFSIGPENWLRGLSPSRWYNGGSSLYEAKGIDVLREPGRLMAGYASGSSLTDTVTDVIRCFIHKPGYYQLYGYGDTGKIYSFGIGNQVNAVATSYGAGQGLEFYAGKIAYAQNTRVGSYDWTNWSSEGICAGGTLEETRYHPLKVGADKNLYIGNKYKLAKWDGAIFTADKLTFDSYYTITALENDGFYLVIGAEGWIGGVPLGNKNIVTIFFWDMVSGQVSRAWNLPDANSLYDLKYRDGFIYAACGNALFKCSFDSPPQKAIFKSGMEFGNYYGKIMTIMNDILYWPEANDGTINSHGISEHNLTPILQSPQKVPIVGAGSNVSAIESYRLSGAEGFFYVATDAKKVYRISSNYNIGVTATSPLIDLGRYWKIHYLKVVTEPLASGDVLTLSLKQNPSGAELLTKTTFSYAENGAKTSKLLHANGAIVNQIQYQITFTAGAVRVINVELYGEPTKEYYAEC